MRAGKPAPKPDPTGGRHQDELRELVGRGAGLEPRALLLENVAAVRGNTFRDGLPDAGEARRGGALSA